MIIRLGRRKGERGKGRGRLARVGEDEYGRNLRKEGSIIIQSYKSINGEQYLLLSSEISLHPRMFLLLLRIGSARAYGRWKTFRVWAFRSRPLRLHKHTALLPDIIRPLI